MTAAPRLRLATVLTTCAVVNVASIYLAQPLLPFIGDTLDAGTSAMSVVQGLLQLGFGVGLVLFGILADTRERRRLLTVMASGLCASAVAAALAPTYAAFLVASMISGMGVRRAVESSGLVVGRDVSIIIHDDELSYLPNGGPDGGAVPLFTATRSSVREAGRLSAEMLLSLIARPDLGPQEHLLEAELIISQSTGPAPRKD